MSETKQGRPTKYKAEYCEQAHKLTLLGATDKQLADFFKVAESTLNLWKLEHEDFSESLKVGKAEADSRVEESLYQRAIGYNHPEEKVFNHQGEILTHQTTKHYPPDSTSMIFWLKNRKPDEWRDRQELTGKDGGPIILEDANPMEIARRAAFLLMGGAEYATEH